MWIPWTTAIIVFVISCVGLAYMAGFWLRRRKCSGWLNVLLSFAIALLWPVIMVVYIIYDARRYSALHPDDDAPAMVVVSVIFVGAPLLFVIGLLLALTSSYMAYSNEPNGNHLND